MQIDASLALMPAAALRLPGAGMMRHGNALRAPLRAADLAAKRTGSDVAERSDTNLAERTDTDVAERSDISVAERTDTDVAGCTDAGDAELIAAVARRDRRALETLYYRYAPRLGRYLWRMLKQRELVEEAVNDVMLVVAQKAGGFDPRRARLSTWLFGIAHRQTLAARARAAHHAVEVVLDDGDPDDEVGGHACSDDDPERRAIGRQLGGALQWALARLSAEHRAVIELTFGAGLGYGEIARIVGCPQGTVKTRMFHARRRLGELLAARGIDDFVDTGTRR